MKKISVFLITCTLFAVPTLAQEQEKSAQVIQFSDSDNDGINDLFRDADGNGVNDVDGTEYRHSFPFVDEDGDGKNDVFLDANGDGVNDLFVPGSGNHELNRYRVLDIDADGINDVTGKTYPPGWRDMPFRDEDGDGINDIRMEKGMNMRQHHGRQDIFIDRDGDGINDGRAFSHGRRRNGMMDDSDDDFGMNRGGKGRGMNRGGNK